MTPVDQVPGEAAQQATLSREKLAKQHPGYWAGSAGGEVLALRQRVNQLERRIGTIVQTLRTAGPGEDLREAVAEIIACYDAERTA